MTDATRLSHRLASAGFASLAAATARIAEATDGAPTPYAAATIAPAAATPGIASLTQVSLALVLVLGLVFALAWLMQRVRAQRRAGAPGIDILAELSLGPKERMVLVQVDRTRLLVGVGTGQVRTLHVLPDATVEVSSALAAQASAEGAPPGFAELLRRSLGR